MLFGHEKGAFTGAHREQKGLFEQAQGGTLFLDEIGEMPMHLQSKLLRVLQERQLTRLGGQSVIQLNVRIVAATNKDLKLAIAEREFREDLYYRIATFRMRLLPLCERPGDIIPLASFEEVRRAGGGGRLVMGLEEAPGQVGLCNAVLVGAPNTSFVNRWWAAYTSFDPQASWAYHSVILPRELAGAHPEEITILSGSAFFSPVWTELKELYEADDGYAFRDNFAVHLWTSQEAKTYGGLGRLTMAGVCAGNGSFHRVARRVLRDAAAEGLLCPAAEFERHAAGRPVEAWRGKKYTRPVGSGK
jgi:hypothetical protein